MRLIAYTFAAAGLALSLQVHAETDTIVHEFCSKTNCADGAAPQSALIQTPNGNLYATTTQNGAHGAGTIFNISPTGAFSTVYNFCSQNECADGEGAGTLVQGLNSDLYGVTSSGGATGAGTAFALAKAGLTTLANLYCIASCPVGASQLIQATDHNFYGTTVFGGANGTGSVFKLTPAGVLTTLYSFPACGQSRCPYGFPTGGLLEARDGLLYGVTSESLKGSVFKISTSGRFEMLYAFPNSNAPNGTQPYGPLIQGADGNLYGATRLGGADRAGSIFQLTTTGVLTTIASFSGSPSDPNGSVPLSPIIQASDGNFYGVTEHPAHGIIYQASLSGAITAVHNFCSEANCIDGYAPQGNLMQAANGMLYGTTSNGGTCSSGHCGVVYALDLGLAPPN